MEDIEQVRVVRRPEDGIGARALGPHRNDRAGMLLAGRGIRQVFAAGGAVGHAHDLAVLGGQIVGVAGRVAGARGILGDDLARMGMVGRDDDQRVRVVLLILESDTDRTILEPQMPLLITPGAAEALAVKVYRLVKVAGKSPVDAVKECLDGYQNPVAAEVMDFQIGLAVKEASDLEFVPEIFRAKR